MSQVDYYKKTFKLFEWHLLFDAVLFTIAILAAFLIEDILISLVIIIIDALILITFTLKFIKDKPHSSNNLCVELKEVINSTSISKKDSINQLYNDICTPRERNLK